MMAGIICGDDGTRKAIDFLLTSNAPVEETDLGDSYSSLDGLIRLAAPYITKDILAQALLIDNAHVVRAAKGVKRVIPSQMYTQKKAQQLLPPELRDNVDELVSLFGTDGNPAKISGNVIRQYVAREFSSQNLYPELHVVWEYILTETESSSAGYSSH